MQDQRKAQKQGTKQKVQKEGAKTRYNKNKHKKGTARRHPKKASVESKGVGISTRQLIKATQGSIRKKKKEKRKIAPRECYPARLDQQR